MMADNFIDKLPLRMVTIVSALTLSACFVGCGQSNKNEKPVEEILGDIPMAITLTSTAFEEGQTIPQKYTGQGEDISPPLQWTDAPEGTKSFALICDDPDAPRGTWDHWILFNIPADARSLDEGVSPNGTLPNGAKQGKNSWGKMKYGGPMPPPGPAHRYFFKLYALDTELDLPVGSSKEKLLDTMKNHTLAQGQLMGRYQRK